MEIRYLLYRITTSNGHELLGVYSTARRAINAARVDHDETLERFRSTEILNTTGTSYNIDWDAFDHEKNFATGEAFVNGLKTEYSVFGVTIDAPPQVY